MNTAVARRLALGDRVVWVGKNDYQPSGPGTITRITAHQVEVLWEDETASRYRRAQLHNLRHAKLICELHVERSAVFIDGVQESRRSVINYWSIARLNPMGIIPKGTPVDYNGPHDRARLAS